MSDRFIMVKLCDLDLLPFQSRLNIEGPDFDLLVESVRAQGVLEPLLARPKGERFEVAAGGRRLRAAQKAGLAEVPVHVKDMTDEEAMDIHFVENLHRADLTEEEKRTALGNYARIRKLDAKQIAANLQKSYSWVVLYLPSEFKDEKMAELGQKGGEAKAVATRLVAEKHTVKTQDMTQCEYCHIASSDIQTEVVNSKPRKLCVRCQGNFVLAPERFTAFFRNVNGESKAAEHEPAPKPLYTEKWEHKLGTMKVQHSKPELDYVQGLRNRNLGQVTTDQVIYVVPTFPDANLELTSGKMAYIYVNMPETHDGKQKDKDDRLQFWLKKKEPDALIINVDLKTGSPKEIVEKLDELEEELKWAK